MAPGRVFHAEFTPQARNVPLSPAVSPLLLLSPPPPTRNPSPPPVLLPPPPPFFADPVQAYFTDSYFSTNTTRLSDQHPRWLEIRVESYMEVFLPNFGYVAFQVSFSRRLFAPNSFQSTT